MKKRLFLVTLLAVFVIAQTSFAETNWKAELKNWSGKTLHVMMIGDPWITAFSAVIPEFEKLTGAKILVDAYGYDATHEKEVLEGSQKSQTTDIVVLDAPWIGEFAEGGYVEDLKPYITKTNPKIVEYNDYLKVFREVSDWKGKTIGMPFAAYFVTTCYRKDLLEAENLKPAKTLDEWKAIAARFTNNPKYPGVYGLAMNNQQGSCVGQSYFEYIWNVGGKPFQSCYPGSKAPYADMKPLLDSPQSIEVVKLFIEMLKYQPEGALNIAWDDRDNYFSSGRIAMVSEWSARLPAFLNPTSSSVPDKVINAVVPAKAGVTPVPPLGGWVMGISRYSTQKDMSWDFIKWFCSAEVHKRFVDAGGMPSRYSALKDPALLAKYPTFPAIAQSVDLAFADCRPRIPEGFEIISTIGMYISRAMTGELTPEAAMKQANKDVRAILQKSGYKMSN